uniref:Transposase n=1 Tax=Steinernema glaseri TaxID=37863 RepID=A0A1I8AVD4_9BILA
MTGARTQRRLLLDEARQSGKVARADTSTRFSTIALPADGGQASQMRWADLRDPHMISNVRHSVFLSLYRDARHGGRYYNTAVDLVATILSQRRFNRTTIRPFADRERDGWPPALAGCAVKQNIKESSLNCRFLYDFDASR